LLEGIRPSANGVHFVVFVVVVVFDAVVIAASATDIGTAAWGACLLS